jgi:hypothetical protein
MYYPSRDIVDGEEYTITLPLISFACVSIRPCARDAADWTEKRMLLYQNPGDDHVPV